MPDDTTQRILETVDNEALTIIVRHHPELAGKTLEQARVIIAAQYPGKKPILKLKRGRKTKNVRG